MKSGNQSDGAAAGSGGCRDHLVTVLDVVVVVDVDVVWEDWAEDDQQGGHDAEHVRPADVAWRRAVDARAGTVKLSQPGVESDRKRQDRTEQNHSCTHAHRITSVIISSHDTPSYMELTQLRLTSSIQTFSRKLKTFLHPLDSSEAMQTLRAGCSKADP